MSGDSLRQGPHQLAQKLIAAGRPCSEATVARGPTRTSRGSSGAVLPVVELVPLRMTARTSAATTATTAPIRKAALLTYWAASRGTSCTIWLGLKLAAYSVVILPLPLIP